MQIFSSVDMFMKCQILCSGEKKEKEKYHRFVAKKL